MTKRIYTVGEVAKILSVARMTVHKMIREKTLRAFSTPGGHKRILGKDVQGFLEKSRMPLPAFLEGARRHILIAGDDAVALRRMSEALSSIEDVEIRTTSLGMKAGIAAASLHPILIVVDIPDTDRLSMDFVPALRTDPNLQQTPILAVLPAGTASGKNLRKFGVHGIFSKPLEPEPFRNVVLQILSGA